MSWTGKPCPFTIQILIKITVFKMMALHCNVVCDSVTLWIGALTKLGLFLPEVCFIYVFDRNLAEQLCRDKRLFAWISVFTSNTHFQDRRTHFLRHLCVFQRVSDMASVSTPFFVQEKKVWKEKAARLASLYVNRIQIKSSIMALLMMQVHVQVHRNIQRVCWVVTFPPISCKKSWDTAY